MKLASTARQSTKPMPAVSRIKTRAVITARAVMRCTEAR